MSDYSLISSLAAADAACRDGRLRQALLLPPELGGQDVPENRVYLPPTAFEAKERSTEQLIDAVRNGMIEIAIVPEYRAASHVPARIVMTAALPGEPPGHELAIDVW